MPCCTASREKACCAWRTIPAFEPLWPCLGPHIANGQRWNVGFNRWLKTTQTNTASEKSTKQSKIWMWPTCQPHTCITFCLLTNVYMLYVNYWYLLLVLKGQGSVHDTNGSTSRVELFPEVTNFATWRYSTPDSFLSLWVGAKFFSSLSCFYSAYNTSICSQSPEPKWVFLDTMLLQ